jgi:hypothetical protein
MKKSINIWNILAVLGFFICLNFLKNLGKLVLSNKQGNYPETFDSQVIVPEILVAENPEENIIGFQANHAIDAQSIPENEETN